MTAGFAGVRKEDAALASGETCLAVADEASRLEALRALRILDTPPEHTFDEAAQVAAAICGTPMAAVNLLDENRQWFKARVGLENAEMPREHAFCNFAIGEDVPLVVPDLAKDPRFTGNPHVTGAPRMRFYAGMPLNMSGGHTVGTLCVGDVAPHKLTKTQIAALSALGRQVAAQLELRAKVALLAEVLADKERVEQAVRERTLLFTSFMEHGPMIGFIKDERGRFVYYNHLFCARFAISRTEWIGKSVLDVFPADFAASYHSTDMSVLATGQARVVEESTPGPDNTTLHWRTHKFRISDGAGPNLLGGLCLDVSLDHEAAVKLESSRAQLEEVNSKLLELSETDGLTGLRNRRAFDERLASDIRHHVPLSLILLDIDHFKRLNDSFGHTAGDDVLRVVGSLLREHSRGADVVARFGGEEFAILLSRTGGREAMGMAERLRSTIANFPWKQRSVTISAGVATRCAALDGGAALIEAADAALYCAKHEGRNRVQAASGALPEAEECEALAAMAG